MNRTRLFIVALVLLILGISVGTVSACLLTTLTLTPSSGPPGSTFIAESVGGLASDNYTILWDGVSIGTGMTDGSGNGSLTLQVPADAATGDHTIEYQDIDGIKCSAVFTVTAALAADTVASDAYVAGITRLPSTGIAAFISAFGIAALGSGSIIIRRLIRQ